jgi:hypothetical protein
MPEKLLLIMKFGSNIRAKQSEERCNGKWLITVANKLKVHGPLVKVDTQERGERVNGYHKQNANDAVRIVRSTGHSTAAFQTPQHSTYYLCSDGLL